VPKSSQALLQWLVVLKRRATEEYFQVTTMLFYILQEYALKAGVISGVSSQNLKKKILTTTLLELLAIAK